MTIPVCKVHNVPMRESNKGGGYYCPKKDGEVWCKERAKPPEGAAPPGAPLAPLAVPSDALAGASLSFAATLFRGAGPEMADEAIAVAIKAYTAMRAVV